MMTDVYMRRGDIIRLETAGGGGYGNPQERDPQKVRYDLENNFISEKSAIADYGLD